MFIKKYLQNSAFMLRIPEQPMPDGEMRSFIRRNSVETLDLLYLDVVLVVAVTWKGGG